MNSATFYRLAWKIVPRLPLWLIEGISGLIGTIVAVLNGNGVRCLRSNLEKLRGHAATSKEVRYAVRSYFRCYAQQFSLSGWDSETLRTSCVYAGAETAKEMMKEGPLVLALTHSGNWDLAGAWFCQNYGEIVTVAEKLDPPELFNKFLDFRESLGMEIIGVSKGEHVFETLVKKVQGRSVLVPLLADRDISGAGIQVDLGNGKALVAAGPAALALRLKRPLIAGHIFYRRENGKWLIEMLYTDVIEVPTLGEGETKVEGLTRAWVKAIEPQMVKKSLDWHMMQKLYVDDLDSERLKRSRDRQIKSGYEQR